MDSDSIFPYFLLVTFIYTFSFALKMNKNFPYFNKRQKIIHHIMIWVIPFLWIMILKGIAKPIRKVDTLGKDYDKPELSNTIIDAAVNDSLKHGGGLGF